MQKPLVIAISGASGSIYGLECVKAVASLNIPIALTLSHAATLVMKEELGIHIQNRKSPESLLSLFEADVRQWITYYPEEELTAPIASGSFPTRGMIVMPCSTTCFAKIANGISESLIERSAECMIKEGRRLAVVPRETPLSAIHLENLLKLSRLGVRVVPAMPAFYSGAANTQDLIDFVIGKVLDQFEISHTLYPRWVGPTASENESETSCLK